MKERRVNAYPEVILSDCRIAHIQVENSDIQVCFADGGFVVHDANSKKSFRTNEGVMLIEGCEIDDISIKEVRTQRLTEGEYFETMYEIDSREFLKKVNAKEWRFEFTEEFYSIGCGLYIGRVSSEDGRFWCHIKLYFKNLIYMWDKIRYDRPF